MEKKITLLIVTILFPLLINAQDRIYKISGHISELSAPAKAYLRYKFGNGQQTDSTLIVNGFFTFSGVIREPKPAYLIVNKNGTGPQAKENSFIKIYLEPGKISVMASSSFKDAKIEGGPINEDNNKLKACLLPIMKSAETLDSEYRAAGDEKRKSIKFVNLIKKRSDLLKEEQKNKYLTFIKENPNSIISLFAIDNYGGSMPDIGEIEPLFQSLSETVKHTEAGLAYATEIANMRGTTLGAIAPDFTQLDMSGIAVRMHDYRGKYLLLDFWASWCSPCRAENPNIVKNFNRYKDKGFNVLGISLDGPNGRGKWIKAVLDDHLNWSQVSDLKGWKNEVAELYAIKSIPQNFLVDPDGRIIAINIQGDALTNKLKEIFDKDR